MPTERNQSEGPDQGTRELPTSDLTGVRVGDQVIRWLGGEVPMKLVVTEVTAERIKCGPWEFDPRTGAEIEEDLGWGVKGTGSFIQPA